MGQRKAQMIDMTAGGWPLGRLGWAREAARQRARLRQRWCAGGSQSASARARQTAPPSPPPHLSAPACSSPGPSPLPPRAGSEATTRLKYQIPTRALLGLRNAMLTATKGTAVLNTNLIGWVCRLAAGLGASPAGPAASGGARGRRAVARSAHRAAPSPHPWATHICHPRIAAHPPLLFHPIPSPAGTRRLWARSRRARTAAWCATRRARCARGPPRRAGRAGREPLCLALGGARPGACRPAALRHLSCNSSAAACTPASPPPSPPCATP